VGLSQTCECANCGLVYVQRQPAPVAAAAGAAKGPSADEAKLAQIRERVAEEQVEKEIRAAAAEAQSSTPRGSVSPLLAGLAGLTVGLAVAAGVYLSGPSAPAVLASGAGGDGDVQALAKAGGTGAQFALGLVYDYGFQGSARNPDEALTWYTKAAAVGDIEAQYYLGQWYRSRAPRPQPAEALYWLRVAADRGQPLAQAALGDMYRLGEGTAKDVEQAAEWYTRAADQGVAQAHCGLARLYAGVDAGYRQDPANAAMHDFVAKSLGASCGLTDYGASERLADWARAEGARRGEKRLAQGFGRQPVR